MRSEEKLKQADVICSPPVYVVAFIDKERGRKGMRSGEDTGEILLRRDSI